MIGSALPGALLVVVLGLAGSFPQATDAAPARNGLIAYQLQQPPEGCDGCGEGETADGRTWIETIRPDGSGRRRVRCSSGPFSSCEDRSPAFSHDGRRLAIIGKGGVLVMRPTGQRLVRLRGAVGFSASWSPEGRRLAYTSLIEPARRGPNFTFLFGVHIVDLAGRIRMLNAMDSGAVSWSHTGQLAWDTSTDDRSPKGDTWVGDASGRLKRRVLRRATRPRWSFQGRPTRLLLPRWAVREPTRRQPPQAPHACLRAAALRCDEPERVRLVA